MLIFINLAGYNLNPKTKLINYDTISIRGKMINVCLSLVCLYKMFHNVCTICVFIENYVEFSHSIRRFGDKTALTFLNF